MFKKTERIMPLIFFILFVLIGFPLLADEDSMTITYCDGSQQVIRLNQSQVNIKSIVFTCEELDTGFGDTRYIEGAFRGDIYFISSYSSRLPDFSKLDPVGSIYAEHLNIPRRSFSKGFPGITDRFEWFAIKYTKTFNVTQAGNYVFRLVSDDGSRLYIDDKLIIDNDGLHGVKGVAGTVSLSPGAHKIRVDYFQGPRTEVALLLYVTPPGEKERVF